MSIGPTAKLSYQEKTREHGFYLNNCVSNLRNDKSGVFFVYQPLVSLRLVIFLKLSYFLIDFKK